MRKLFLLLVSVLFSLYVAADVEIRSEHLTTSNGISNNSVRCMYQDSKGFIWMGTLNGLSRYDGNSFVTYRPSQKGGIALGDHRIRDLVEDKNGFLWIATSAEVKALAKMPSRDELLAMLLQVWKAPITNFVIGLNALKEQKEKEA